MLTLVEFIHPLRKGKQRDPVLGVLYFFKRYKDKPELTAAQIRTALREAKVPKAKDWNVNAIIANSAPHVAQSGATENGVFLYEITDTGEKHIRELLELPAAEPEVEHEVSALTSLAGSVTDEATRGYIEESIKCLRVGALRAAVVFLWTGAVATIREQVWQQGAGPIEAALQNHNPNAKFKKKDDFWKVKDADLVQIAQDLGLYDQAQKKRLKEALDLRNDCGHPVKYVPGEKKASSFIEDMITIVWR